MLQTACMLNCLTDIEAFMTQNPLQIVPYQFGKRYVSAG